MKKIAIFLLVLFLIPFTAFGYESSGKAYIKSGFISGVANLNDISNFGGIVIKNIYVADMQNQQLSDYLIIHELLAEIEHHLVLLSIYFSEESSKQWV